MSNGQRILNNVVFSILDPDLSGDSQLSIDGRDFDRDEYLERLSQITMNWIPYDENNVIFIYPVKNFRYTTSTNIPIETVKYSIYSLPTALEVIGAISTYYSSNRLTQQAPELFGVDNKITIHGRKFRNWQDKKEQFNQFPYFDGLEMIRPGVYFVHINNPQINRI